jgi:hypothetical protein
MNSLSIIANRLLAISFLMIVMCISGMEKEGRLALRDDFSQNLFLSNEMLPQDVKLIICDGLISIFYDKKCLEDTIKAALNVRSTCKHYHAKISPVEIGKLCKHYDAEEKNKLMKKLLESMNDFSYRNKRQAAFLLTYAGADDQACSYYSLLSRVIDRNDKEMTIALFENDADINQQNSLGPSWFRIKDIDTAQMFIAKGVDLQAGNDMHPNILWFVMYQRCSFELIDFYVKQGVDVKKRNSDGQCILHQLVGSSYCYFTCKDSVDKEKVIYAKIGELLLNTAPELRNMTDCAGMTPLGLAYERLQRDRPTGTEKKNLNAIIALLKKKSEKKS